MPKIVETFGEAARIHVPTTWTIGALFESSMPVGTVWPEAAREHKPSGAAPEDQIGQRLVLPFIVIETGEGAIVEIASRTMANATGDDPAGICEPFAVRRSPPSVSIERTRSGFTVTFITHTAEEPERREIASLDEAVKTHVDWVAEAYNGRTIEHRIAAGELGAWISSVPLVVTFDMWLPNGEVAHNYSHLRDFCADLAEAGAPPGAVIYIPGWCGPFDAGYPYYAPVPELGGATAFAEAMAAAHQAGYRIMVHTLGWGTDPYKPGFERHVSYVMRTWPGDGVPPIVHPFQRKLGPAGEEPPATNEDDPLRGPFAGWPGGGTYYKVDAPRQQTAVSSFARSSRGWLFDAPPVPERCEAVVSIGGDAVKQIGAATVTISINGRSLTSPAAWFTTHERYHFPFTFLLAPGVNPVEITVFGARGNVGGVGEDSLPPAGALEFTVEEMWGHDPSQNIWTQPAVAGRLEDPRWHKAYLEHLARTVADHDVDLVHIDATAIWRWDEEGMYAKIRRGLPRGTCFGTEVASEAGMAFFQIKQTRVPTGEGGVFSNVGGTDGQKPGGASRWQPEMSDLPHRFSAQYGHFYAHLCSGRGFVPHHTSCSVEPLADKLSEEQIAEVHEFMRCCTAARIAPSLRVNYRDYGLDAETKRFLGEMTRSR